MVVMFGYWLITDAPRHVKKVEIIFPVVGHSFIPPDRVFVQIENILKKHEVVNQDQDHQDTIAVQDWKLAYTPIIKSTTS